MSSKKNNFSIRSFESGMTVRELKQIIKNWPEKNNYGEDCEVWLETGDGLSGPVRVFSPLNMREDDEGNISSDIIFESGEF